MQCGMFDLHPYVSRARSLPVSTKNTYYYILETDKERFRSCPGRLASRARACNICVEAWDRGRRSYMGCRCEVLGEKTETKEVFQTF